MQTAVAGAVEKVVATATEIAKAASSAVVSGIEGLATSARRGARRRRPPKKAVARKAAAKKAVAKKPAAKPARGVKKVAKKAPARKAAVRGGRKTAAKRTVKAPARKTAAKKARARRRAARQEAARGWPDSAHAERLVDLALEEDLLLGDVTSEATIDPAAQGEGRFLVKEELVLAGTLVAVRVFDKLGAACRFERMDGTGAARGEEVGVATGPVHALLAAERTALNFLQRLSGVATTTRRCADALAAGGGRTGCSTRARPRPGWRMLEKAAVRAGGGKNHRFALGDGILIKDNHVAACGGVAEAVGAPALGRAPCSRSRSRWWTSRARRGRRRRRRHRPARQHGRRRPWPRRSAARTAACSSRRAAT